MQQAFRSHFTTILLFSLGFFALPKDQLFCKSSCTLAAFYSSFVQETRCNRGHIDINFFDYMLLRVRCHWSGKVLNTSLNTSILYYFFEFFVFTFLTRNTGLLNSDYSRIAIRALRAIALIAGHPVHKINNAMCWYNFNKFTNIYKTKNWRDKLRIK